MGNTKDYPVLTGASRHPGKATAAPGGKSPTPPSELTAIAEGLGSLTRSAQMLSINAAIAAARSGPMAPEISVIAQEIKRVATELETLTARLGRERA